MSLPAASFAARPDASVLWSSIQGTYSKAVASGAVKGIPSTEFIEPEAGLGVEFIVRIAEVLKQKPTKPERNETGDERNPFLPYEEELWVQHLSETHTLLLNKFNLVDHHTLVVTRGYESQDDPLNAADLAATSVVLDAMPHGGLAYFNHGPDSGTSLPHKHLQVVPLPLGTTTDTPIPLGDVVAEGTTSAAVGDVCELLKLPFRAYACRIDPMMTPEQLEQAYTELARAAGVQHDAGQELSPSYGWQMTRHWMMLVPRSAAEYRGIGANAVSFSGTLFLKRGELRHIIRDEGPMQVLAKMALPW